MTPPPSADVLRDVAAISRLSAVPTILRVIAETTGLRFTLVARVTQDEWVACAVHDLISFGLQAGGTLDVATTLCRDVRSTRAPVVMDHASTDPTYCDHPTPKLFGFESYLSYPLYDGKGEYFGTLCGLDPQPAVVNQPKVLEMFKHFAELISLQLAAEDRLSMASAALLDARETAQLREQFVAVLGHDLRNPLASMSLAAEALLEHPLDDAGRRTVERLQRSTRRMTDMVTDLLDFARAKLGGGIGVALTEVSDLETGLRHVVAELQAAHPARELNVSIDPLGSVRCDPARMAQLVSNLLSNALTHGAPGRPVAVRAQRRGDTFVLSVHNEGAPIGPDAQAQLFLPYTRGGPGSRSGLGLGLYIVKQIADAHGGTVAVESTEAAGTRFTFTMPLASA